MNNDRGHQLDAPWSALMCTLIKFSTPETGLQTVVQKLTKAEKVNIALSSFDYNILYWP